MENDSSGQIGDADRASIPSAEEGAARDDAIAAVVANLNEPLRVAVRSFCDAAYESIMTSVQVYLADNAQFNIGQQIASLRYSEQVLRRGLTEINRKLGLPLSALPHEAQEVLDRLQVNENRYYRLTYAVANKYEGEERHETALRYICEREAASAIEARQGGNGAAGAVHESAVPQADAQGDRP